MGYWVSRLASCCWFPTMEIGELFGALEVEIGKLCGFLVVEIGELLCGFLVDFDISKNTLSRSCLWSSKG